jgi:hypothetical protein
LTQYQELILQGFTMNLIPARPLLLLSAILLPAAPFVPHSDIQQVQASVAGKYDVVICKRNPCAPADTTNVVVRGILVLSDSAYTLAAFPDSVRLPRIGRDALVRRNGCSATAATQVAPGTFAAIGGMELITWTRDAKGRVLLGLHKTGELEYQVELNFSGDGFSGTGHSQGTGAATPTYSDDIIVGKKSGAADHKPCSDSAMKWLGKSNAP